MQRLSNCSRRSSNATGFATTQLAGDSQMRRVRAVRICALAAIVAAQGCRQSDENARIAQSVPSSVSSTETATKTIEPNTHAGPLLIPDSTIVDPRIETLGDQYVSRLPADMARVLYDSLPGFTPIQQSAYPPGISAKHNSPLSVVVGDFNGDSRQDLVMVGRFQNTPIFLMLLGKSEPTKQAQLIVIARPEPGTPTEIDTNYFEHVGPHRIKNPDDPTSFFDLRTDGVLVQNAHDDKIYAIYFWDHGEVQQYSLGGD
jgi:hypothetical protein